MTMWYVLKDRIPIPCDLDEWVEMYKGGDDARRVAATAIGDVYISTVFTGYHVSFGSGGPPLVFETMAFGGKLDDRQVRTATWEEAEAAHARMVAMVEASNVTPLPEHPIIPPTNDNRKKSKG